MGRTDYEDRELAVDELDTVVGGADGRYVSAGYTLSNGDGAWGTTTHNITVSIGTDGVHIYDVQGQGVGTPQASLDLASGTYTSSGAGSNFFTGSGQTFAGGVPGISAEASANASGHSSGWTDSIGVGTPVNGSLTTTFGTEITPGWLQSINSAVSSAVDAVQHTYDSLFSNPTASPATAPPAPGTDHAPDAPAPDHAPDAPAPDHAPDAPAPDHAPDGDHGTGVEAAPDGDHGTSDGDHSTAEAGPQTSGDDGNHGDAGSGEQVGNDFGDPNGGGGDDGGGDSDFA